MPIEPRDVPKEKRLASTARKLGAIGRQVSGTGRQQAGFSPTAGERAGDVALPRRPGAPRGPRAAPIAHCIQTGGGRARAVGVSRKSILSSGVAMRQPCVRGRAGGAKRDWTTSTRWTEDVGRWGGEPNTRPDRARENSAQIGYIGAQTRLRAKRRVTGPIDPFTERRNGGGNIRSLRRLRREA
jgi:hypothetical protein